MKKLILITVGAVLLRRVAKYFKINSLEDLFNLVKPYLKNFLPPAGKKEEKFFSHSLN